MIREYPVLAMRSPSDIADIIRNIAQFGHKLAHKGFNEYNIARVTSQILWLLEMEYITLMPRYAISTRSSSSMLDEGLSQTLGIERLKSDKDVGFPAQVLDNAVLGMFLLRRCNVTSKLDPITERAVDNYYQACHLTADQIPANNPPRNSPILADVTSAAICIVDINQGDSDDAILIGQICGHAFATTPIRSVEYLGKEYIDRISSCEWILNQHASHLDNPPDTGARSSLRQVTTTSKESMLRELISKYQDTKSKDSWSMMLFMLDVREYD